MKKPIPHFRSEDTERAFWARHDSAEYMDWSKAKPALFPNLKPSTRTISIRLPESIIQELKSLANQRDVPYQSLLKVVLAERVQLELSRPHRTPEHPRRTGKAPNAQLAAGRK